MKLKNVLSIATFLAFALTASASDKRVLNIEIRSSKPQEYDSNTCLAFATDSTIKFTSLNRIQKHKNGEIKLFQDSYELVAGNSRRAIIIYINCKTNKQPDQVFSLIMPRKPKPMDWTGWQNPNFVETNAVSNFRFDYAPINRSTNFPANSFELRYKIE